jgi:hypothetical protein
MKLIAPLFAFFGEAVLLPPAILVGSRSTRTVSDRVQIECRGIL